MKTKLNECGLKELKEILESIGIPEKDFPDFFDGEPTRNTALECIKDYIADHAELMFEERLVKNVTTSKKQQSRKEQYEDVAEKVNEAIEILRTIGIENQRDYDCDYFRSELQTFMSSDSDECGLKALIEKIK